MDTYIVISFDMMTSAIAAESILKEGGFSARTIPLPTEISAECGLAILVTNSTKETLSQKLKNENINYNSLYRMEKEGIKKKLERI